MGAYTVSALLSQNHGSGNGSVHADAASQQSSRAPPAIASRFRGAERIEAISLISVLALRTFAGRRLRT
jgi:hypothetical protein